MIPERRRAAQQGYGAAVQYAQPTDSKLLPAPWEYAGLLLTYWCSARCAFCYVYGSPDQGGEMTIDAALWLWRGLAEHAALHGRAMRIHLSGGEPFGNWPRLAGLLRAAKDAGLPPAEKIETNAFWATDDGVVRARIELLDALGVGSLVISTDVYHQEFVPLEYVVRCARIARQVLGRKRVRVRWADFLRKPHQLAGMSVAQKQDAYRQAISRHRDRLTGRAAELIAPLLPGRPAQSFRGQSCARALLGSRHVHIDGYGHVFPGVCTGIILGVAGRKTLNEIWQDLGDSWRANPVIEPLVTGGSCELFIRAKSLGYKELEAGYADACHLCFHVRRYLFDRGVWREFLGPSECYGETRNRSRSCDPRQKEPPGPLRPA